ncbi:MAG: HAMP domain-containing histidine kinase [Proteobacteria bacterium]|nr:HAMP domain-containing histidine kinase [Cystobacterineae bacterium]MCL2313841.1 HAMP domain-containing histidine kinase [Pseudomonadota bacterium]
MRLKSWFRHNVELFILSLVLLTTAPLMVWWTVLMRNNFLDIRQIRAQLLLETLPQGPVLDSQLAELDALTQRKLRMVFGEAGLGFLLCLTSATVLFSLARRRGVENRRMRSLLQLTTHELKTPLAAMRALLQSLQLGSIPEERRQGIICQGLNECNRLEHLAETTLAYQRSVAKAANPSEILETTTFLKGLLEHRTQTFPEVFHRWQPGPSAYVKADTDSLRVILENLLDNAHKYGNGDILIEDTTLRNVWQLRIVDKGQGFEPHYAEALFEPFVRTPGKRPYFHGNGLGLYLSRRIAHDMGGKLYAHSEGLGKGSCFTLEVPLACAQEVHKTQTEAITQDNHPTPRASEEGHA